MPEDSAKIRHFTNKKEDFGDFEYDICTAALRIKAPGALKEATYRSVTLEKRQELAGLILAALDSKIGRRFKDLAIEGNVPAIYNKLVEEFGSAIGFAEKQEKRETFEKSIIKADELIADFAIRYEHAYDEMLKFDPDAKLNTITFINKFVTAATMGREEFTFNLDDYFNRQREVKKPGATPADPDTTEPFISFYEIKSNLMAKEHRHLKQRKQEAEEAEEKMLMMSRVKEEMTKIQQARTPPLAVNDPQQRQIVPSGAPGQAQGAGPSRFRVCSQCGKNHSEERCWVLHPEQRREYLRRNQGGRGRGGRNGPWDPPQDDDSVPLRIGMMLKIGIQDQSEPERDNDTDSEGWVTWDDVESIDCFGRTSIHTNPLFCSDPDSDVIQQVLAEPKVLMLSQDVARVMSLSGPKEEFGGVFVVDTGAAVHIVNDSQVIIPGSEKPLGSKKVVKLADDSVIPVRGSCDIQLDLANGSVRIKDVQIVPGIPYNIISAMTLLDNGAHIRGFDTQGIRIEKDGVIMNAMRVHGGDFDKLCIIRPVPDCAPAVFAARFSPSTFKGEARVIFEHKTLGHLGQEAHRRLIDLHMVDGLGHGVSYSLKDFKAAHSLTCMGCAEGNARLNVARTPPSNGPPPSRERERLHFDIMQVQTTAFVPGSPYNGSTLALIMKAESVNYLFAIPLKFKSETPKNVLHVIAFLKGRDIIVTAARYDRAAENMSQFLADEFKKRGIASEPVPPYQHWSNGAIESPVGEIGGKNRASMISGNIPKSHWAEVIVNTCLVRNMVSLVPGHTVSAFEAVHQKKPDVSRFLPPGTQVIVTIPPEKRVKGDKHEARGVPGMVLGMENYGSAYRVFTPKFGLVVSSSVITITKETMDSVLTEASQPRIPFIQVPDNSEDDPIVPEPALPTPMAQAPPPQQATPTTALGDQVDPSVAGQPLIATEPAPSVGREGLRPRPAAATTEGYYAKMSSGKHLKVLLTLNGGDVDKALAHPVKGPLYQAAIIKEMRSFKDLNVYEWVKSSDIPPNAVVVDNHIVLTEHYDDLTGTLAKLKCRCTIRGDKVLSSMLSLHGTYNLETSSPTAAPESFRLMVHASQSSEVPMSFRFFDVSTAYLNARLPEEEHVYMRPPKFAIDYRPGYLWKIVGAIYGLPQAGRAWYKTFKATLETFGWRVTTLDPCVFYKDIDIDGVIVRIYLLIYVDDGMLMGPTKFEHLLDASIDELATVYKVTRSLIGEKDFLGVHMTHGAGFLALDQASYIDLLCDVFRMHEADVDFFDTPADTSILNLKTAAELQQEPYSCPYSNLVSGLLWLTVRTRPDIAFAIGVLTRGNASPTKAHWSAALRVLKYLKGTRNLALVYSSKSSSKSTFRGSFSQRFPADPEGVHAFTDADYASDKVTRKSTSGCVILGRAAIIWLSKLQEIIAQSVFESELISLQTANNFAYAIKQLAIELGLEEDGPVQMAVDNEGVRKWLSNDQVSRRVKHIDVRYLRAREDERLGRISYHHVPSVENVADIFTKPLPRPLFIKFREALGLQPL